MPVMQAGPHLPQRGRKERCEMGLYEFVRKNRAEIDRCIARVSDPVYKNDEERRAWVLNDEGLYRWARSEGVKI